MEKMKIWCENTNSEYSVDYGTTLMDAAKALLPGQTGDRDILAALVDGQLKPLDFHICRPHKVQFIDYDHANGIKTYVRSLCFVLQKAVHDLFPDKLLLIKYALPSGHYCEIHDNGNCILSGTEIKQLKARMKEIISQDLPFRKEILTEEEAEKVYAGNGQTAKIELLKSLGRYTCSVYFLDGCGDTFYGPLVPSTGYMKAFELRPFGKGICLQYPQKGRRNEIPMMTKQVKLAAALEDHDRWCRTLGTWNVGTLNQSILEGHAKRIINLA